MKKRTAPFGPGGMIIVGGLGGLVVLLLAWQFVIPFFFGNANSNNNSTNSSSNNNVAAAAPTPALVGSVVDAASGRSLQGASIRQSDGTEVAKVDASGTFTLTKMPSDKDKLTVDAPGYQPIDLPLSQEAAKSINLKPNVLNGTLVDSDTQQPIANRLVRAGDQAMVTDAQGQFSFTGLPDGSKVTVDLIGYELTEKTIDATTTSLTIPVHSTAFDGSLTDTKSGKPIANAIVKTDEASATTGQDGKFHFSDLQHTDSMTLTVRAPGYKIHVFTAADLAKGAKMDPFIVHAVYVPGIFAIRANYDDLFTPYLDMADKGEINTIILGVKSDEADGLLEYESQVPIAQKDNLIERNKDGSTNDELLIDIPKVLAEAHKHGLYVSARYVVMRDPGLAKAEPTWALQNNKTGGLWADDNGLNWPNPFIPQVGDYNAALAKELSGLGFDEIQYDYIRFPTDGPLKQIQYKSDLSWTQLSDMEDLRTSTIEGVVKKAYDVLQPTNTFLSLDVFGMSLWRVDDNNIGQQYNNLVMMSDYICPMVYPSHFDEGTLDESKYPGHPVLYPGVIITKSGIIANELDAQLHPIAKYRPWLEDFSKTWGTPVVKNTPAHVLAQIQAAEDNGSWGWTLWNAEGDYTESVLLNWAKTHKE